jgi:endonuclease/exonuclease/phosphatase family metal-dependent hydrolase
MKRKNIHRRSGAALVLAILLAAAGCDFSGSGGGGGKNSAHDKMKTITVMTWNLQALFDGTEDGGEYDEYREAAGWTAEKYRGRLNVIAGAVGKVEPAAPDIIAIQEIESARALADLAGVLSKYGYAWTHFAGNPGMSLGVGILSRLPLEGTRVHSVSAEGSTAPRPILETRVSAGGETLALFVCHWKSKLGGEDLTESTRRASARVLLRRIREMTKQEPELPIIIMGDLNENYDEFYRRNGEAISALLPDDPRSAELSRLDDIDENAPDAAAAVGTLQADFLVISQNKPPLTRYFPSLAVALYSPWSVELQNGSYYYGNNWETIDHFLLSKQLFNGSGWEYENSAVAAYEPFTGAGGRPAIYNPKTGSGLSDHLPLLLYLRRQ